MKYYILSLLALLITTNIWGQVAIIQDKDGYTNVRSKSNVKSDIIYRLVDNEVFFYYEESFDSNDDKDWIYVMIPRNKFSIITDQDEPYTYGYIHKSRLKPLDELEPVTNIDNQLIFTISKVDTSYKKVDNLIDGFVPYGLDIYLHQSTEVTSLDLLWDGKLIPQPKILTQDLYNITFGLGEYRSNSSKFSNYSKDGVTFIHQECADGAGYFEIVWVFKDQRIIQRLAGWIY